jgi:hypothetical protein
VHDSSIDGRIPIHFQMLVIDRFILLVRDLRRNEAGIAVPTAMMALIASFALASVAVLSTVNVQSGTNRDRNSKQAIAAADAGANVAMLRLNRYLPKLTPLNACVGPNGETQIPSGGWCPTIGPESIAGATYSYQVSAYTGGSEMSVVATGTSGKVSRRVNLNFKSISGDNVFLDEKLIGEDEIEIEGSAAWIETDIGTNGNINANAHPVLCGDIRKGPSMKAPTPSCNGEVTEGTKTLPPVTPPADNWNCRLSQNCTGTKSGLVDTYSKNGSGYWDAASRSIRITGNGTLTMGGPDYLLCKVDIQSGKIYMPVEAHVRIFMDTPEHCGMASGSVQVEVEGGGNIISGYNPTQGYFEMPGIYMLGNGGVSLSGNSGGNEVIIYGPQSHIDIGGSASWNALIAGKSLKIHGNPFLTADPRIKPPDLSFASMLERTRYVECTGATVSPPNASC